MTKIILGCIGLPVWSWATSRALKPLIVFEIAFKGAAMALGAMGTAWVVAPLISRTGRAAVTNADIAEFLLSPAGVCVLLILALSVLLGTMIEHIGVLAIAATNLGGREATLAETLSALRADPDTRRGHRAGPRQDPAANRAEVLRQRPRSCRKSRRPDPAEKFEDQCEVSSLDAEGLMKAKAPQSPAQGHRSCDLCRGRPGRASMSTA